MHAEIVEQIRSFEADRPLERARTIPARWYFDADLAQLEEKAIFARGWQMVGRRDQVRQPGSFLTTQIGGEPLLVIRDGEGTLRGFYNVCRHRAAPLLTQSCGQVTRLRCRYHGWTYDLAGRLRGTPEFEGVQDFCRDNEGLVPVTVAEWGPFVWISMDPAPQPLADFVDPLAQRTKGRDWSVLQFVEQRVYDLSCNWKVFVDNYLDGGYHVQYVHPALAGILDYAQYHSVIHAESSVQISPLQAPKNVDAEAVASVRTGEALYWWLFPNLMINLYDNCMDTNLVLPLGPEKCRVIFDYYVANTAGAPDAETIRQSIAVGHQIQLEDVGICEEVQRGLHSRSYSTGRFSVRREGPGYHFHQLLATKLKKFIGEGSDPGL